MIHRRPPKPIERRLMDCSLHLREAANGSPIIEGYAVVWDVPSVDFGGFVEVISPGAFDRSLADKTIRRHCFWNHDSRLVLGSETNGSLILKTDKRGLWFEARPQPTTYANDLLLLLRAGDVNKCSFGFVMGEGGFRWGEYQGKQARFVTDADFFEASVVTEPAYPDTEAMARFHRDCLMEQKRQRGVLDLRRRMLALRRPR